MSAQRSFCYIDIVFSGFVVSFFLQRSYRVFVLYVHFFLYIFFNSFPFRYVSVSYQNLRSNYRPFTRSIATSCKRWPISNATERERGNKRISLKSEAISLPLISINRFEEQYFFFLLGFLM